MAVQLFHIRILSLLFSSQPGLDRTSSSSFLYIPPSSSLSQGFGSVTTDYEHDKIGSFPSSLLLSILR